MTKKYLIFSFIPLVILLFLLEVLARMVFFQQSGEYPLALLQVFNKIRYTVDKKQVERRARNVLIEAGIPKDEVNALPIHEIWPRYKMAFFYPEAEDVLEYFREQYERYFLECIEDVEAAGAQLLVLNVSDDIPVRAFFRTLTAKYHIAYLDAVEELEKYPRHWVHLSPEDEHLSRLGHQIVAEYVAEALKDYHEVRSTIHFETRPVRLGNLPKNSERMWEMESSLAYRVITNAQGFRMQNDLEFPKTKQRILVLGDSYTFGPFLPNAHLYTTMLDRMMPDAEVINAGIMGYSIPEELELFRQRAKYVEPDIVILQVYTNDIRDLSFLKRIAPASQVELSDVEAQLIATFWQKIMEGGVE
ncbi:hypothetical protein CSA56_07435 [candidate division KSB3 bacterium]|uniref:SGNH hydrolase-type esterase domain-containing protein n=1 Tax=candidate division KSB3 bacterium TaxID=2044937 RepID=A0A2G6KFV0_9BACT|nr:MAG: hypothetical protein CSA56_07435 [candidate division KSB3 bacterium]